MTWSFTRFFPPLPLTCSQLKNGPVEFAHSRISYQNDGVQRAIPPDWLLQQLRWDWRWEIRLKMTNCVDSVSRGFMYSYITCNISNTAVRVFLKWFTRFTTKLHFQIGTLETPSNCGFSQPGLLSTSCIAQYNWITDGSCLLGLVREITCATITW